MSRNCVRCDDFIHPSSKEHVCKDVAARHRRREAQVTAVCDLLWEYGLYSDDTTPVAQAIVAKLANMGVEQDS